jgi:hypothetical protein
MSASESVLLTSAVPGPATIKGGRYIVGCNGTSFGTVAVQSVLPGGGTTFATISDAGGNPVSFTAVGWKTVDLPPGQVQLSISTTTASVNVSLTSIPT